MRPLRGHLEQAQLVGAPEAVLDRPQQPEGVVAVALERQHRVDDVLEDARPGQRAVLGDVADEHDGDVAAPWPRRRAAGRTRAPAPPTRPLAASRGSAMVWMLSTTTSPGRARSMASTTPASDRIGREPEVGPHRAEPLGAQPDLLRALLGVTYSVGPGHQASELQQERALADARLAAERG